MKGFWSYVHADDSAEGGRITSLANDLKTEYEMLTGDSIDLFLDKEDIAWGEAWRDKIDDNLSSIVFFVPVLTPRYFLSTECRRELHFFARRASSLGYQDLILPLLYIDIPALRDKNPDDELLKLVKQFQWEDWTETRFEAPGSPTYRRAINRITKRLTEANFDSELQSSSIPIVLNHADPNHLGSTEELGTIDHLAAFENELPNWNRTISLLGEQIERIGGIMNEANSDISRGNANGSGFSHRLVVARNLAAKLEDPNSKIVSLGTQFSEQLHAVDGGLRVLIELATEEAKNSPDTKEGLCFLFESILSLVTTWSSASDALGEFVETLRSIEGASRDLRPSLRKMRQGLAAIDETKSLINEWSVLINDSGIDC